jgi:hypothetical protein
MKCRHCGTEIADKALICFRCGEPVAEAVTKPYVAAKKKRLPLVYIVFAVLVLLAIIALYLR